MFSNFFFSWVLLFVNLGVCPLRGLHRVLLILFSCYLSIWHFSNDFSVPIFYSEIVFSPLHPVVCLFLFILHQHVWIFIFLFSMVLLCFLYCLTFSWYRLGLPSSANIFWGISSANIVRLVYCCLILVLSFQCSLCVFSFLSTFACCHNTSF